MMGLYVLKTSFPCALLQQIIVATIISYFAELKSEYSINVVGEIPSG